MKSDFDLLHGNFITDEYTHPLRLESKLSDLRVGYADSYSNALRLSVFDVGTGQK